LQNGRGAAEYEGITPQQAVSVRELKWRLRSIHE
jgi:hypothetical protein